MYWAFQTITTVGYGNFGAYNYAELGVSIIFMGIGTYFFAYSTGSMLSIMTENRTYEENLREAIKSLERFAEETEMDNKLTTEITSYLQQNYKEVYSLLDNNDLVNELNAHLKEELIYA